MMRDIEYAALAVRRQIVEKFGAQEDLTTLTVQAAETVILVDDGKQHIEGTRDNLLAWLRRSNSYRAFFEQNAADRLTTK